MKSRLAALALAACLALAGCFVSDKPLFKGAGDPLFGRGLVTVTTFEAGSAPDTGQMRWTPQGYIEPDDNDKNLMTFHHLPGGGWFSPWYVGQAGVGSDGKDGYMYMLYRKDGDRLFGLACGRCDNPYTHGALENFRIHGDTVEFDIAHQDWGDGPRIPFERHIVAHIAMNEMHMDARRPDQDRPGIVASLIGPIAVEATAGNVYGE